MKRILIVAAVVTVVPLLRAQSDADRWWAHVAFLADDKLEGRETGSDGHHKAAEYIAEQFRLAGLKPGGVNGYLQPVSFKMRKFVEEKSSLTILRDGKEIPVVWGDEAMLSMRIDHAPILEAPMVFVGYGLVIPEANHDDLAGVDLTGKVAVLLTGTPPGVPGPLGSHYSQIRWSALKRAGAVGGIAVVNPKGMDIPWQRQAPSRFLPQMVLADATLDESAGQQLGATVNPERAEKFFEGTGHTFTEILDLANASKPLPTFDMKALIRSVVAVDTQPMTSENVVGVLPGMDPKLKDEYVVVSAHFDHLGLASAPVNGDRVFNGAMDNASGVATLIETAAAAATKKGFKRSIAFVAVTAEEKGLLGSRFFVNHPTIPPGSMVANLNTDMFLPLYPMKSLVVQGLEESDLAADLRAVAGPLGIDVLPDPEPERNAFTRSDQYSFIRRGIPALSLKVGFKKDSPEHEIAKKWRTERYHAVTDDLSQPVDKQAAVDFNRVYVQVVEAVANRPTRPAWNPDSFFKRFAPAPTKTSSQ
jgi:hypothetical protein